MTISGIVLFLTPSGRIANWTDWTYLRLTKHQWGALHIWLSLIFLAASFFHVYFNWHAILNYLKDRRTKQFALRLEWVLGVIIIVLVVMGTLSESRPFSSLVNLKYKFRHYWENDERNDPVVYVESSTHGGIGRMTLEQFCNDIGIHIGRAKEKLQRFGLEADNNMTLREIANQTELHPSELARIIEMGY